VYSPLNIVRVIKSRRIRWAGHVAHMEERRGVYRVLVGRPERKRPVGRPRCKDNIKMDLTGRGIDGGELDSAALGQGPVAGFCEHCDEPSGSIKKAGYSLTR
jgi:hypothetical protein